MDDGHHPDLRRNSEEESIKTEDGVETVTPCYLFSYGDGRLLTYEELEVNNLKNFYWEDVVSLHTLYTLKNEKYPLSPYDSLYLTKKKVFFLFFLIL